MPISSLVPRTLPRLFCRVGCGIAILTLTVAAAPAHAAVPSPVCDHDRDIVFSAQRLRYTGWYYNPENTEPERLSRHGNPQDRTLEETGPYHLYRVNPNGTGLTRLTGHTRAYDIQPQWSADRRTILFLRSTPLQNKEDFWYQGGHNDTVLCRIQPDGSGLRTLYRLPVREKDPCPNRKHNPRVRHRRGERTGDIVQEYRESPDGRYIAVVARVSEEAPEGYLLLLDAHTGRRLRQVMGVSILCWKPGSEHTLFLAKEDGSQPCLCDARTGALTPLPELAVAVKAINQADREHLHRVNCQPLPNTIRIIAQVFVSRKNASDIALMDLRPSIPVRLLRSQEIMVAGSGGARQENGFWSERSRWYSLPIRGKEAALVEAYHGRSDGGEHDVYRADFNNDPVCRMWMLHPGNLIAVSPDGSRCAVATDDWAGPYKRGGARCGPLEIISTHLLPGQPAERGRTATAALMTFAGGDWR